MVLAAAFLSLVLLQEAPSAPPTGEVVGVVHGSQDPGRIPLADAMVEWTGAARRAVVSDREGAYRLPGIAPGRGRLRVTHAGYEVLELDVRVPPDGRVRVDVELRPRPVLLAPVQVRVAPGPSTAVPPDSLGREESAGVGEARLRAVEAGTGLAEAGLQQATRRLTGPGGGEEEPEPRSVLFMRGSTAEMKLVLLDGAPVYTPFHVGGLIPSFDPATLGGAELFVGGAPARYDGGLSYILDLHTRNPARDRLRGSGSVDLVSARASLEGPLTEGVSVLVAGRALHRGGEALLGPGRSPYGYGDALVRVEAEPAAGQRLRATGFWNRESVYLDFPALAAFDDALLLPGAARWGNEVAALTWSRVSDSSRLEIHASTSRYDAVLPLHSRDPVLADGATRRSRLALELGLDQWGGDVRYGVSLDRTALDFGARRILNPGLPGYRETGRSVVVGGYMDGSWPVARTLRLRGGARVDHFPGEGVRFAPRVALSWLLAPDATLTLAAGRYHQQARSEAVEEPVLRWSGETSTLLEPTHVRARLPVAGASHLVLSLDQELTPGVRLGLEGFLKEFSGGGAEDGPLHSSGVDVRVQRSGDRVSAWLGYSLSWLWEASGPDSLPAPSFTGRHLLTAGFDGRLGDRGGLTARVSFGDGLPYTSVPVSAEDLQAQPSPGLGISGGDASGQTFAGPAPDAFLRVDAELYGILAPTLGGRRTEIRPYLRLLNALDRRDALFYYFEPWRGDGLRPLAGMSVLPVAGLEWRF